MAMIASPVQEASNNMDTTFVIEEDNLQEQHDEVLAIRSMFEGSDEERINIISEPDESGHGLFRIVMKIPVMASAETVQVDLMMPADDVHSPQHNAVVGPALDDKMATPQAENAAQTQGQEDEPQPLNETGAEGGKEAESPRRAELGRVESPGRAELMDEGGLAVRAEVMDEGLAADDDGGMLGAAGAEGGVIEAPSLNFGNGVALQRSLSGQRWTGSFTVHYLSPLTFQLTLPPSYPSSDPPSFILSCAWLRGNQLTALCRKLDKLWEAMPDMPIIYTWLDFLENETLSFLGLSSNIVLIPDNYIDGGDDVDDRVISECQDLGQAVHTMLQYSQHREGVEFCKVMQECSLCFDGKLGSKFFRLQPCKHHFCFDCISTHCNMHVKEGTIQHLTCPEYECKTAIHPGVLLDLLSPEAFLRWETLSLQKTLDEMDDVTYCPRCQSVVISEQDMTLKLGHCMTCFFSFCTDCEQPWHTGSKCTTELDRLDAQLGRVHANDVRAQERFRELRRQAEVNAKTIVILNQKTCPQCKIPVEKSAGCNKLTCRCGAIFCWRCGKAIQGYSHFQNNGCVLITPQAENVVINRPRQPDGFLWMQAQAEAQGLGGGGLQDVRCIQCKQINYRLQNNNHIKCWNCKVNMCAVCKQRITGVVTRHFSATGCPQHS